MLAPDSSQPPDRLTPAPATPPHPGIGPAPPSPIAPLAPWLHTQDATAQRLRIAVVGAGIIGITTAYELAADGHEVTVYDRCESVSAEGSFANAGLLAPGCVSPASAPGLRPWLLRGLLTHDAALRWRPGMSRAQWRWLLRWWRACNQSHADDVRAMVVLARYSQERLAALTHEMALDYERSRGVLLLLRHEREFRPSRRHVLMLRALGVEAEELTPARCREIEPGLGGDDHALAGGVHLVGDGVGNCRQFAQLLRDHAASQLGVVFRFNTTVTSARRTGDGCMLSLNPGKPGPSVQALPTVEATHDALVLCTGASAVPLLAGWGWRLPLLPVHGHSVTLPLHAEGRAPRSAVVDARSGVAITRLGSRVRITGGFVLGRQASTVPSEAALSPLYAALDRWFPYAAQRAQPQLWTGARPMLPEGPPLVGAVPDGALRGSVWLNLGQGAHGWTLACGSARLLADQIAGRTPAIDASPYGTQRWLGAPSAAT